MQSTYHTIYKTTNTVNGKIYIGKHQTQNLEDGYLGSGKLLRQAIDKYGVENFRKEILFVFDNEADMNDKEAELVTEEFVLQESNYNLCVGGRGGWSYVNREGLNLSDSSKEKMSKAAIERVKRERKSGEFLKRVERLKSISKSGSAKVERMIADGQLVRPSFKGRKHTEATKAKMSKSSKGKSTGEKNSQYGTKWITNGSENKKLQKADDIPDGWYLGRT